MDTSDDSIYEELVERQQDMVVKFNPEGRLLFVNSVYCDVLGKSREELTGSVFMPAHDQRHSEQMAAEMTKLFRPPHRCQVDQWIPSLRGSLCISWSARSITNGNGEVTAIIATGRDITRLRQQHYAIRNRDEELIMALESGNQMYFSHGTDHTLKYVSPRLMARIGSDPQSGKRLWTDYLTDNPVNARGLERTLKAIETGRREPPYRLEFIGRNGTRLWAEVNEIPIVKNKKTVAIAGYLLDVTEKKKVEEGLIEAEILLKNYGVGKKSDPENAAKSPFAALKSFFHAKKSEEDDDFPEIPDNLQ